MSATVVDNGGPSLPALKSHFRRRRTLQPFYSGGSVALTSDGQWLVSTLDQQAVITDVKTGRLVATVPGDTEDITSLALTPSDTHLIVASRSLSLRIFSLTFIDGQVSFALQRTLPRAHEAPVAVLAADPTSTLIASGAADGAVKVWDIAGGFCTHVFRGHGGIVSALRWNMPSAAAEAGSKGKRPEREAGAARRIELFTGSIDGRVRLWDLTQRPASGAHKPAAVLTSHVSVVRGLALSNDGRTLITGARDRTLAFWTRSKEGGSSKKTAQTGGWELVETITAGEGIEAAGFLEPGSSLSAASKASSTAQDLFWTGGSEGEIRLWSCATRATVALQPEGRWALGLCGKLQAGQEDASEEARAITECHYVAALHAVVSVHADQNIVFRSVPSPESTTMRKPPLSRDLQLVGFNDEVVDLALLSPHAGARKETHLAVATNSSAIRVYTLESDSQHVDILPSDAAASSGHSALVLCLDKTYDGRWLASGAKDRTARVWAWCPKREAGYAGNVTSDGTDLGMRIDEEPQQPEPVEAHLQGEWRCVAVAEGHAESVGAVAFARRPAAPGAVGAPFMVTASQDRTAKVWDLTALAAALERDPSPTTPLKLRSLTTLKVHDKDVNALDVSPNNALLLSGSQDRTAKVWTINYAPPSKANSGTAAAALKPLATCSAHKRGVWAVRFSPADAAFITASADRTARLWSLKDFACVKTFEGHTNGVLRAEFLGDKGMQLITSASDGLVKLWNVRDEQCVDTMDGHEERVWGLVARADGSEIISAGADSVLSFWEDRTVEDEVEKSRDREAAVEREQQFSNLLTLKDYRNAIALALASDQPRRLLNLFSTVNANRPDGDAATSAGRLLDSALGSAPSARTDAAMEALKRAGVFGAPAAERVAAAALAAAPAEASDSDTGSITGSSAVDGVLARLAPRQLVQLLTYIRDWNTTARTSVVAQTVLHAVLRFHSAEAILAAFTPEQGADADAPEEEEETEGRRDAKAAAVKPRRKPRADLASVIDGLVPYTERHYARADRLLTESAMLEYTLASMDAVLGDDLDEDMQELELLDAPVAVEDDESESEEEESESDASEAEAMST